jgi:hypothetical protein
LRAKIKQFFITPTELIINKHAMSLYQNPVTITLDICKEFCKELMSYNEKNIDIAPALLEKALSLDEELNSAARQDKCFNILRNDTRFQLLVS